MLKQQLKRIGNKQICPIAVLVRDRKLLIGFRHYTKDKWKPISVWTCPGGRCDEGETIESALRREVAEETGIKRFQILDYLGEVSGAKKGDIVPIFYSLTTEKGELMEPEKFSEWRWVDFKEYPKYQIGVFNPEAEEIIIKYLNTI